MDPVFGPARTRSEDGEPLAISFLELCELAVAVRFRRGEEGHAAVLRDLMGNPGATSPARQMHIDPTADPAVSGQSDEAVGPSLEGEARPQAGLDHT